MKPGEFSKNLWRLALTIPPGRVTTYATLCVAAGGHPRMAQMVTYILGKSPDVDKIPWHRIVYSDGKVWLSPKYDKMRRELYKKEGIELDDQNRIKNFEHIIYSFDS
ncbi:MGMT family protein [Patescibacteria group bacterium]|nr:MGMT family protein [Patescibacteria group bacterium]